MKMVLIGSILSMFLFVGCTSTSVEDIERQCKQDNKIFKIESKFNFRTGQDEYTASCY